MMLVVQSVAWSVSRALYDDNNNGNDNSSSSMDYMFDIDVNMEANV